MFKTAYDENKIYLGWVNPPLKKDFVTIVRILTPKNIKRQNFQNTYGRLRKSFPAGIYLLKVNNRNTRTDCEICPKLTIKTPVNGVGVVLGSLLLTLNIFHISHLVLVFLLLTLNM